MSEVWMYLQEETSKVKVIVKVTDSELIWTGLCNNTRTAYTLKSRQILTATVHNHGDESSVVVSYVKVVISPNTSVKLQRDYVTFYGSPSQCEGVVDSVQGLLRTKEGHRPKRMLFFMNPNSGWRNSVKQYANVVAPVFAHCGVHVHTIETQYHEHVGEILAEYDLSSIDVVVSMGGDGSLNQVITGMLLRAAKDARIDMDDETSLPQRPHIPIGTIPGGSGNAISLYTNIGRDQETAAYNIVLGRTTPGDVMALRNQGRLLSYTQLQEAVSWAGEALLLLDKFRFLGPWRYNLFPFVAKWCWRFFHLEIEYLPAADDLTNTSASSTEKDKHCSSNTSAENTQSPTSDRTQSEWRRCVGDFSGTSVSLWKTRSHIKYLQPKTDKYRRPDVSSGKAVLTLGKFRSLFPFLKYMNELMNGREPPEDPDTIEQFTISEARIKMDTTNQAPCRYLFHDGDAFPIEEDIDLHFKVCEHALDYICIDHDMVSESMEYHQQ